MLPFFLAGAALLGVALPSPFPAPAAPSAPATVHLQVSDDTQGAGAVEADLLEWLVVRLHDDGYAVVGDAARANVDLVVEPPVDGRGWRVAAHGTTALEFTVESSDDPAVTRLEVLHRSFDALEGVEPRDTSEPPRGTFGLAVASSAPAPLTPAVAMGVLDAGGTLVPSNQPAEFLVCADEDAETRSVSLVAGDGHCRQELSVGRLPNGPPASTRTAALVAAALAQKDTDASANAIAAAMETPTPEAPPPVKRRPGFDGERAPGLSPPSRGQFAYRNAPRIIRVGASAGIMTRSAEARVLAATDLLLAADLSVGREPGIGFWLDVQVRPVTVTGPLRVLETVPAIGPKFRPATFGRVSLELGGLIGAEIHTFRFDGETGVDNVRGTDTTLSLESALGVSIRLWGVHELRTLLRFGGGRERIHRIDGVEVWRRGALHFGATVGLTFGAKPST